MAHGPTLRMLGMAFEDAQSRGRGAWQQSSTGIGIPGVEDRWRLCWVGGESRWIPGGQRSWIGRQRPADGALHTRACVNRLENLPGSLVAEVGHQRQQAEQHTGRRQQDGQQLRELNSEESHVSFPRLAGAGRTGAGAVVYRKTIALTYVRPQTARIASKGLSGGGHPLRHPPGSRPKD
jgi:hypothetical protein